LDVRDSVDFKKSHLEGAFNLDVGADSRPNPFKDPSTLIWLFDLLTARLSSSDVVYGPLLEGKRVVLLSHDGNVSRLACSILRKRGVEAYTVNGGIAAMIAAQRWPVTFRAQL
jgi:rhodanese-related sulfurtransferase